MTDTYHIPPRTRIGHVHLKVSDLQKSLDFYCGILGFQIVSRYGEEAAFISAGRYHHHIGLNTWHSKWQSPADIRRPWLYHTAILYPTRKDLAAIYERLLRKWYPLSGAADHGVSEAIYLDDPDTNGVELYRDRPQDQRPRKSDGSIEMFTHPLDLDNLLAEHSK